MLERPFAHCYETGGMRRVHLRGRENILKRLPVHVAGFNLSLVLRLMLGKGTPRGLQDLATQYFFVVVVLIKAFARSLQAEIQVRTLSGGRQRLGSTRKIKIAGLPSATGC